MLKRLRNPIPLAVGAGLSALLIGTTLLVMRSNTLGQGWSEAGQLGGQIGSQSKGQPKSTVLPLVALSASQRASQLEAIASGAKSLDRNRARFLLADDLIQQKQGKKALTWLEGLEQDYQVLAPQVALKRAQAYEVSGDKAKANAAWQELLERYGENSVAAEALFALGRNDPKLYDQAIASFPSHPRTIEIAWRSLKQNPNQLSLLLLLLNHDTDSKQINTVLEALQQKYAAQLKPEDWEAIAYIYWDRFDYDKAGETYAKATRTPLNLYRAGRGRQLRGKRPEAIAAYQQLLREFPNAKDTGLALVRLAQLVPSQQALPYLEMAINKFPEKAGEALLAKAKILDATNSTKSASQARQLALSKYADSEAVAEYRWSLAKGRANAGDFLGAWQWAQPITKNNPDSELAPKAAFWVGKWATRLGHQKDGKASFEYVLSNYQESYYAWRSAGILGLDVGTFNTVRDMTPQVVRPFERSLLPAGSEAVKELYQLGQNDDAWTLWQAEFRDRIQPTVAQQFTDGVLRLGVGQNIKGITKVESLGWWRDTPEERSQISALKQESAYWHALYPFPFLEYIENWSQERKLNPLLVTALMRQESRFEPAIRSVAGAMGLMQVMPGTGAWIAQAINIKSYALDNPNDNIKFGTWYLDHTHETYSNNSMFAVASYNAGPGNVSKWIRDFGLSDPDEFVEAVPFAETQGYIKHVFENYWNYLRLYNPQMSEILSRYGRK
ncbi:transglycosylase SLT domain-containing protein [Argonema antarcticum]|uniref:lytic transglycosylase domain-containing protein n=1 Tax=Argonema antarcticum TaxID=2942763 RepID=UPI0020119DBD|nr:transglycosylase SLT domain-containing protein [Argonema antarcticum]MCL1469282.1 transglycosylase SLT domain-containing protein [Argonema antarcticum A004/B2]